MGNEWEAVHELSQSMQGFVAFGISFAILMQIWFKHYGFFRRYGLQDSTTRVLNSVLLFIVLLQRHAWRLREELELNEIERYDTRAAIVENSLMAAVPATSLLLAAALPPTLVGWAGLFYFSYAPLLTWYGVRAGRGRRPLEQRARKSRPPADPSAPV